MREIKFRAWSPIYKEFWYMQLGKGFTFKESDILMQYTGLKDKNGEEIYEGDVLCEFGKTASGNPIWKHQVCFGIYDNGEDYDDRTAGNGWYLKSVSHNYIFEFINIDGFTTKLVIIGNIYENPELLGVKNGD